MHAVGLQRKLRASLDALRCSATRRFSFSTFGCAFTYCRNAVKPKIFLALLLAGVAALVVAQRPVTCTAAEAAKYVGQIATVTDKVDGVHQSGRGNIFLNLGGKNPNQIVTAFIPAASAGDFSNPQQYEGKTVAVSGKITLYHGKPEIIVTNVSQIIIR